MEMKVPFRQLCHRPSSVFTNLCMPMGLTVCAIVCDSGCICVFERMCKNNTYMCRELKSCSMMT